MIMISKNIKVLNLILFSCILSFSIMKYIFPIMIIPVGWIPFIESPYPISVASILKNIFLIFAIIINLYYIIKSKR